MNEPTSLASMNCVVVALPINVAEVDLDIIWNEQVVEVAGVKIPVKLRQKLQSERHMRRVVDKTPAEPPRATHKLLRVLISSTIIPKPCFIIFHWRLIITPLPQLNKDDLYDSRHPRLLFSWPRVCCCDKRVGRVYQLGLWKRFALWFL